MARKKRKGVDKDYMQRSIRKTTNTQGMRTQFIDTNTQERRIESM